MLFFGFVKKVRNTEFMKSFGNNLKRLRLLKKLSRETLAAYADIETMQVYRIETGKINTTISTVLALAKGLEIPPKRLFDFNFE